MVAVQVGIARRLTAAWEYMPYFDLRHGSHATRDQRFIAP